MEYNLCLVIIIPRFKDLKEEAKNKVTFVKGYIQNTLPQFVESYIENKRHVALVHCDMDIYEPFLVGLENSWKVLNKNGVIIIGKLNNPELMGKTVAFNEFLAKAALIHLCFGLLLTVGFWHENFVFSL